MSTEYPPAHLRITTDAVPAVRAAIQQTLEELGPHLATMSWSGLIHEPWLGDSESAKVSAFYNSRVMLAEDGPFHALKKLGRELASAVDALAAAEATYRGTDSENAVLVRATATGGAGGA